MSGFLLLHLVTIGDLRPKLGPGEAAVSAASQTTSIACHATRNHDAMTHHTGSIDTRLSKVMTRCQLIS